MAACTTLTPYAFSSSASAGGVLPEHDGVQLGAGLLGELLARGDAR